MHYVADSIHDQTGADAAGRELRRKAHEEHRSLNEVALRALERGLGMAEEAPRHHDLDDLAGTWVDDPEFDRAIEAMDQVDPELWR